jgi:hypothetical protein
VISAAGLPASIAESSLFLLFLGTNPLRCYTPRRMRDVIVTGLAS